MKYVSAFLLLLLLAAAHIEASKSQIPVKKIRNSISGQVWDPFNNPVVNIDVELMNELSMTVARQRTATGGRFLFSNVAAGTYKVRILTTGTNYLEQAQDASVNTNGGIGSDNVYLDIHLKFDPRKINTGNADGLAEPVFVQEGIPSEARELFKKAVKLLAEKNDAGLAELEKAVKISPDYYDALNRLGEEYVRRKKYVESLPFLVKAIDVNRRSYNGFFNLAFACFQLNQKDEAVKAAQAAAILKPDSIGAQLLLGTILRTYGKYIEAEKTLLKAKKLTQKTPVAEVHWQLALLYNKTGRNKESAAELEEFLKIEPNSSDKKEIQELIDKLRKK
jgi:tetratricopeptide (TPR) repeat protein